MHQDRRSFALSITTTGASFHKQTKTQNETLKTTFPTLAHTVAMLVTPPGEGCTIDIVGVVVRSKLSYAKTR